MWGTCAPNIGKAEMKILITGGVGKDIFDSSSQFFRLLNQNVQIVPVGDDAVVQVVLDT